MFRKDPEVKAAVDALCERWLSTVERGDILPWEAIEDLAGGDRNEDRPKHIIQKFRRRMQFTRGIFLKAINNVGLKALTDSEQIEHGSQTRQRKIFRQCQRAIRELTDVEPANLSIHEQTIRARALDAARTVRKMARRAVKDAVAFFNVKESLPRFGRDMI